MRGAKKSLRHETAARQHPYLRGRPFPSFALFIIDMTVSQSADAEQSEGKKVEYPRRNLSEIKAVHTKESEEDAQNEGNHSAFRRICRAHSIDIRVCVDVVDMQMGPCGVSIIFVGWVSPD